MAHRDKWRVGQRQWDRWLQCATSTDWAPRTATLTVGGQVVTVTQAPPASTETRFYYDTDVAGSVTQITNSAGAVVAAYDYLPFGTQIAPPAFANTVQFAGQERDAETQLD